MVESLLLAYFLHHVTLPPVQRPVDASTVRQLSLRGRLRVDVSRPQSTSVPPGAQRIEMLRLHTTADCSNDVPLHSISIRRRGMGAAGDISAIYAVSGGRRISSARPFSRRDGIVDLNIRRFRIPACGSRDVVILADFSETSSIAGEHRLEVYPEDFDTNGALVTVNHRETVQQQRRTSGRSVGRITVSYPKLSRRVRYGAHRIVSRLRLESDSRDDHIVRAITLVNEGSASGDDLQNLFIEASRNQRLTNIAPLLDDDRVRLVFDPPLVLRRGSSRLLRLRADVRASSSRTIRFRIEEPGDLEAAVKRGRL